MYIRIPWRTWTGRNKSHVSSEKYPISRVCPKCGSGGFRVIGESITVPFGRDRECVNCSTRYAPRQRKSAGIAFILLGLLIFLPFGFAAGDAILALLHLNRDPDYHPSFSSALCPGCIALLGGWFVFHGCRAFARTRHAHGHRKSPPRPERA